MRVVVLVVFLFICLIGFAAAEEAETLDEPIEIGVDISVPSSNEWIFIFIALCLLIIGSIFFFVAHVRQHIDTEIKYVLSRVRNYYGEPVVYLSEYADFFSHEEVGECSYSKKLFKKEDLVETTGDAKRIGKKYLRTCKPSQLTFAPSEMASKEKSKLVAGMKDIQLKDIPYKKLREAVHGYHYFFNQNEYWAIVRAKQLIGSKYTLYDKASNIIVFPEDLNKLTG